MTTTSFNTTVSASTATTVEFSKLSYMYKKGWQVAHRWINEEDSESISKMYNSLVELASKHPDDRDFAELVEKARKMVVDPVYVTENARGELFARMDRVVC